MKKMNFYKRINPKVRKLTLLSTFIILLVIFFGLKITEDKVEAQSCIAIDYLPGQLCGTYMVTQGVVQANYPCKGLSVKNGCPAGFGLADLGYFEAGHGPRQLRFCVKQ